jgi:NAD(P)-dependent dehydrogenase (short-subunit alcohol dehydrogenase family)
MMRMRGRKVLITGGASGIGLASARRMTSEGARVALLDRDAEGLAAAARELGDACLTLQADVTDEGEAQSAVSRAASALQGLDGLVNAAGVSLWRSLGEMTLEEWRRILSINLDGPFIVCHAALPALKASGKATIVNIASGAGLQPRQNFSAYCASKGGLVLFTKAIAMDLAPDHIRVNAVCPGIVLTPLVERNLELSGDREAAYRRYISRNLMQRFGTAEEVADAVLFLSCDESSFITGSALSLDGGSVFH